jgi:hypothetical protein
MLTDNVMSYYEKSTMLNDALSIAFVHIWNNVLGIIDIGIIKRVITANGDIMFYHTSRYLRYELPVGQNNIG